MQITKTCGAQRGKVDFNSLKFGRQLQGRIQFCLIYICLTHKSVDYALFCPATPCEFFPCPAPQTFTLALPRPVHPCCGLLVVNTEAKESLLSQYCGVQHCGVQCPLGNEEGSLIKQFHGEIQTDANKPTSLLPLL